MGTTAKEIADLVRATNVLDDDAAMAARRAINDRAREREAVGESAALEDALFGAFGDLRDMARQLATQMDVEAAERTAVVDYLRAPGRIVTLSMGSRLTYQSNHAAAHLVGIYEERCKRLAAMLGLYAAIGDLVRSTPEERAAVLAERERKAREMAEKEAALRSLKKGQEAVAGRRSGVRIERLSAAEPTKGNACER